MANIVFDFLHNYETGERREPEPATAYQYDEGHVLEAVLPEVITSAEIHYWIRGMEEADAYTPTSITPNADGSCTVLGNIPNKYFETNGELRIYIVVTDGTASITTYEGKLHIAQRAMPDDYVDDDPENEATRILTEAQAAATTATQQAQAASASAGQAQQSAQTLSQSVEQIETNTADITQLKEEFDDLENDVIKNYYGTWEQNRIMTQSGTNSLVEVENSAFCHSNFINTGENAIIEVAEGYQIFAWDSAFDELGHQVYQVTTKWETGTINYTHRSDYPYLAICVMKTNSANIVPSEAASAVKVYTSTSTQFALKSTVNELSNSVNELSDNVNETISGVSKNTEDISNIESALYSSIKYIYQMYNGKIVVSNNAITIQSDNTRAYTDYILMNKTVNLSIKTGYKYFAYLVDNKEGIYKTYSPIAPFSGWMNTDQHIDFSQTHPFLIVAVIKDASGSITPEEASNALTISTNNEDSIQKNIGALNSEVDSVKYQVISNVPSDGQILYNADNKQQSNYIVNAVSYADGVIIACRANGSVVRIGYDGTEEKLLEISGSNMDWRLCWIDSDENVYVSPHVSYGTLSADDRGLYRLAKNENSFTKVISLYNPSSSVPTETQNNNDTIWTMCEDDVGNLYAGVYAHTVRANPAIYKSADGGLTWTYLVNFNTTGMTTNGMHIHSIIYSKWQKALYCIVGEINTIFKSVDGGNTWIDLQVALKVKGTAMCATPYGIFIGSDGAYNCEIDVLLNDDVTHKTVFSAWANTVFAIRRSDLTGFLYAFTKVDSSVNRSSYFPPLSAIEDSSEIETWRNSVSVGVYNAWKSYYDSVINTYPEDAVRPQHCAIIVSRDGGLTWDVLKKFALKTSGTTTYIDGFWTTGFFKNGECLTGRMESNAFANPVVISEGKHKYVSGGCDLDGEIFIRTNSSSIVEVL